MSQPKKSSTGSLVLALVSIIVIIFTIVVLVYIGGKYFFFELPLINEAHAQLAINDLKKNFILEKKCLGDNSKFYDKCDFSYCGGIIDYQTKDSNGNFMSSGSFEGFVEIKEGNGKYIVFSAVGFNDQKIDLCKADIVNPAQSILGSERNIVEDFKDYSNTSISEKILSYDQIYSIADNSRLECSQKYGPPFNSMNQQFSYNDCMNYANTWELDQLGRTDRYLMENPDYFKSNSGGGCLIATATYGSELAPEVQKLRELRDNSLLQTESGTSFMNTFNDVYYSFSPIIADYERENPIFKEMVKVTITPMITSLSILNHVDMDSEESVLGYGISLIMLNVMMYVGIPASIVFGIRKKH